MLKDLSNNKVFKSNIFTLNLGESLNISEDLQNDKGLLDTIELDIQEIKTNLDEISKEIGALEQKDIATDKTLTEMQQNIENIRQDISNTQEKDETQDTAIKNIQEAQRTQSEEIARQAEAIAGKVDKVNGKSLSTNDFTNEYKQKLDELNNYDDTTIKQDVASNTERISDLENKNEANRADISTMQEEQKAQDKSIEENRVEIEKVEEESKRIREDIESRSQIVEASGESITLKDSSSARFSKIEICGNMRQERREGYNNFNKYSLTGISTSAGAINYTDDILTTPVLGAYGWIKFAFPGITLSAGTHYLSFKAKLKSGTCDKISVIALNNDISNVEQTSLNKISDAVSNTYQNVKAKIEVSENLDVQNIFIQLPFNAENAVLEIKDVMLANKDAEYEAYGAMPSANFKSEIQSCGENGSVSFKVQNKNIVNLEFENEVDNVAGLNFSHSASEFSLRGTATGTYKILRLKNIPKLGDGTHTFSANVTGTNPKMQIKLNFTDKEGNYLWHTSINQNNKYKESKLFNIDLEKVGRVDFTIEGLANGSAYDLVAKIQLEEDTETDYIAHEEQSKTIPVQKKMFDGDKFAKKNDKCYEQHAIKELILTGTEKMGNMIQSGDLNVFSINKAVSNFKYSNTEINCLSNAYAGILVANRYKENTIFINSTNSIVFATKQFATNEEFLANLAEEYANGTPVKVYYVLKEPEMLECTEEQSKILDEIEDELHTYKNVTTISSDDEISLKFNIAYTRDLDVTFDEINKHNAEQDTNIQNNTEEIEKLKAEQVEQNNRLTDTEAKNTEQDNRIAYLETENKRLKSDLDNSTLEGQASGESITLNDSSNARFRSFEICGNTKQKVTKQGINLIDLSEIQTKQQGKVDIINNGDGSLTLRGTSDSMLSLKLREGTLETDGTTAYTYICYGLPETCYTNLFFVGNLYGEKLKIFTATADKSYTAVITIPAGTTIDTTIKPFLIKGVYDANTIPAFEQFVPDSPTPKHQSPVQAVGENGTASFKAQNKNIFNAEEVFKTQIGAGLVTIKDGKIFLNGTFSATNRKFNMTLKAGKYFGIDSSKILHFLWEGSDGFLHSDRTHTYEEETIVSGYINSGTYSNTELKPAIFAGEYEQNAEYVAHAEQSKVIPVQQEMFEDDKFVKKDRKWYEQHAIKEVIVDGVNYCCQFMFPNGWFNVCDKNGEIKYFKKTSNLKNGNVLCDKLKVTNANSMNNLNTEGVAINEGGSLCIKIDNSTSDNNVWTKTKINEYLSQNPFRLYAELETPELLECTSEQNAILDDIEQNLHTYKNVTHVTSEDEVSLKFNATYTKDLETYIESKINNLATAIVASKEV